MGHILFELKKRLHHDIRYLFYFDYPGMTDFSLTISWISTIEKDERELFSQIHESLFFFS